MLVLRLKEVIMKKIIFWILAAIAYEVIVVGFGSYKIGYKLTEALIERK